MHAQLESLQNTRDTHSQYRNTSNPLPQPPEPLPSHRLPAFLRPGGAANGPDSLLDTASYPPHSNPNGNLPNGIYPATPEPAGISHTHVHITQPVAPRPTRGEAPRLDQRSSSRVPSAQESVYQQDRRSRSGSTRTEFVDRSAPDSRRETSGGSRESIARTASPSRHATISSPSWSRHPFVEERRSDEERETVQRRGGSDGPINRRSVSGENAASDMDARMASAAAYIYGYGNGYSSGYRIVNEPRSHTPSSRQAAPSQAQGGSRRFPLHESPEAGTNGLGLTGVPPRGPMGSVIPASEDHDATPMNRAVRLGRRHSTQVVAGRERSAHGLGDNLLLDLPPHSATRRPHGQSTDQNAGPGRGSTALDGTNGTGTALPRRRGTSIVRHPLDDEEEDGSPRSETTWGTVPSASLAGNSLSDLGMLLGLHNGGVRGQGSGATAGQNGVDGNITSEGRVGNEPDGESGTPTLPGAFSATPIGPSALGLITEDEGDYVRSDTTGDVRQPRRTASYTATSTQGAQADHSRASRHGRRAERNRDHRRHASQPTSAEVLTTQESGNITTNALSLTFDASPPPHDSYNVSIPSTYSGAGREIFAPTPVFGGPNIIHFWSDRS